MRMILFLFFMPMMAHALLVETLWTDEFSKEVRLECFESFVCQEFCESDICLFPEDYCRNCIGQNIRLQYFLEFEYEVLGRVKSEDWISFFFWLAEGHFISLGERSAYNLLFSKDTPLGNILCVEENAHAVVFFSVDPDTRQVLEPKFLICSNDDFTYLYGYIP